MKETKCEILSLLRKKKKTFVKKRLQWNGSLSDWRLVNVFGHAASAYDEDLKTLVETAFRAAGGIVAHRFVTCSVVDQSWIDTYIFAVITSGAPFGGAPMTGCSHGDTGRAEPSLGIIDDSHHFSVIGASTISTLTQDCACLHWMIPNKNTFDDDCVVGQLKTSKGDNMCNITLKNWTWTYDQAGKAASRAAEGDDTRDVLDRSVFIHVPTTHTLSPSFSVFGAFPARHSCLLLFWSSSSSFGVNTTAGVILNATNPRWWSDAHSDYYMDDDGTVSNVSLSVLHNDHMGIITDAVAIAGILDIIVPETAAEMDYENLLNPSDDVYPEFHPFLLNIGPTWCVEYSGETVFPLDCGSSGDDLPVQNKQSFIERNPSSYQVSNPLFNHRSPMKLVRKNYSFPDPTHGLSSTTLHCSFPLHRALLDRHSYSRCHHSEKIYQHQLDSHWRPCHNGNCIRHYDPTPETSSLVFSTQQHLTPKFCRTLFIDWSNQLQHPIHPSRHWTAVKLLTFEGRSLCADGGGYGIDTSNSPILHEWESWPIRPILQWFGHVCPFSVDFGDRDDMDGER
ncbi:hypothetical protein BLNAU_23029 [Blattamonas nauphoetae]|uniref:Uncharacterized protein n=1 Tax=Blattamonas nauphoetae TaxID=2049346 RepID=A0ABQ9WRE7_9EUKA|nr:hypothetical protein BLNAU_23029 [Blattamonas nauphoetae]